MKPIRKILCLCLCLVCVICLLAACDSDTNEPKNSESQAQNEKNENNENDDGGNTENGDDASPHTHVFGEWTTVTEATCTAAGSKQRSCTSCPETETETIPALNHDEISHEAKEPTCTEIGWDAYVTCSRCDYSTYAEKVALGHDEIEHEAKAPTYTESGWDAYVTCSRCDYTTYAERPMLIPTEGLAYRLLEDGTYEVLKGTATDANIVIPPSYQDIAVTGIAEYAFSGCDNLTSITIPDSVTSIGDSAFSDSAYYNNENNWENGILYIGNHLIKAKETISGAYDIKSGTKTIAYSAFSGCNNLTSITIPDSVTSISTNAFAGCSSLTSITIPDSVTSIGGSAFYGCSSLTSVTIPDSVTSIGGRAFYNCDSLTSITIPDSVTSIGNSVFGYCDSLTSVTLGNSVTSIGFEVFYLCSNLTSVTIGNGVTSIGNWAFNYCSSLTDIYFTGTQEEWNAIEKSNAEIPSSATIHFNYVPSES